MHSVWSLWYVCLVLLFFNDHVSWTNLFFCTDFIYAFLSGHLWICGICKKCYGTDFSNISGCLLSSFPFILSVDWLCTVGQCWKGSAEQPGHNGCPQTSTRQLSRLKQSVCVLLPFDLCVAYCMCTYLGDLWTLFVLSFLSFAFIF